MSLLVLLLFFVVLGLAAGLGLILWQERIDLRDQVGYDLLRVRQWWDRWRGQRRQPPAEDAGIDIFDDREDATEAQVHAFFDALAATPEREDLSPPAPIRWEQPMISQSPLVKERQQQSREIGAGWGAPPRPAPGPITRQFDRIVLAETKTLPREHGPAEASLRPAWAGRDAGPWPTVGAA